MLARVFREDVVTVLARPGMEEAPLHPAEAACIARAVERRRREFTAGRACAREALLQLGISGHPLLVNPDRTPSWPSGVVGSISHCDGACAVAVARRGEILGLGFDVERRGRLTPELLERILTPTERARLRELPSGEDWATAVFSAKESTYKCYYPLARQALGFHDVEVELRGRTFRARLVRDAAPAAAGARAFEGRLAFEADLVYTAVTLRRSASASAPDGIGPRAGAAGGG